MRVITSVIRDQPHHRFNHHSRLSFKLSLKEKMT